MTDTHFPNDIVVAGHPFVSIGMGEHNRLVFKAVQKTLSNVANIGLRDIYGAGEKDDRVLANHFSKHITIKLSSHINIFTINGDEVQPVMSHLSAHWSKDAYNIVCPAWELNKYPKVWAKELDQFDEVWSMSKFGQMSLAKVVTKPVLHMPLPYEPLFDSFLGRRYFGIPESSYVFLFGFDFFSFLERKNPAAVIRAFQIFCDKQPREDVRLVIKINNSQHKLEDYERFIETIESMKNAREKIIIINKTLKTNEMKNLVRCCDSFVSLHRTEGFGLGIAEAMYMGKPVIVTGYSGNMDFVNKNNACVIPYTLIPVGKGNYPHSQGQVWADPDAEVAANAMQKLVADRDYGRTLGERASRTIRQHFSYRAAGLRYFNRLQELNLLKLN